MGSSFLYGDIIFSDRYQIIISRFHRNDRCLKEISYNGYE